MIVGISGAQGQGKSTVISNLAERGNYTITSQTSRNILDEWGVTLDEVNSNPEMKMKFQEKVFINHVDLISEYTDKPETYFIERTFADIFTYTAITLGAYNEYSEWLTEYYDMCKQAQRLFDFVILLDGLTQIEDDGVRSVNPHFTKLVGSAISGIAYDMGDDDRPILYINDSDSVSRVERIEHYISLLGGSN